MLHLHKYFLAITGTVALGVLACVPGDSDNSTSETTAGTTGSLSSPSGETQVTGSASSTTAGSASSTTSGDVTGAASSTTSGETQATEGSESSTTSSETLATSGSETGSGSETNTTDSGEFCSAYDDDIVGPAVGVTLTNKLSVPVFVQVTSGCKGSVMEVFELLGPDSDDPTPWKPTNCYTCEDAMSDDCWCADKPCIPGVFLKIEPGASYVESWSGGLFVDQTLPDECLEYSCPAECEQLQPASPGSYTFRVLAGTAVSLECCDCIANEDGWCFMTGLSGGEYDNQPFIASGVFNYPEQVAVEIPLEG